MEAIYLASSSVDQNTGLKRHHHSVIVCRGCDKYSLLTINVKELVHLYKRLHYKALLVSEDRLFVFEISYPKRFNNLNLLHLTNIKSRNCYKFRFVLHKGVKGRWKLKRWNFCRISLGETRLGVSAPSPFPSYTLDWREIILL